MHYSSLECNPEATSSGQSAYILWYEDIQLDACQMYIRSHQHNVSDDKFVHVYP